MGVLPNVVRTRQKVVNLTDPNTMYARQLADTIEQFANFSWVEVPAAFLDLSPAIYDIGYTANTNLRISGSGLNKVANARVTLKQTPFGVPAVPNTDPSLPDSTRWEQCFLPSSAFGQTLRSIDLYLPRVTIATPTRLHLHYAKNETASSGSVGIVMRAAQVIEAGSETRYTYIWARKIADL